jgi:ribosomal protein S16
MATKSGNKGRYICKVGFYDIYAKDTLKPRKESKFKWLKGEVKSTEYVVLHAKKVIEKGLKTKDMAVTKAMELLGPKKELYGL